MMRRSAIRMNVSNCCLARGASRTYRKQLGSKEPEARAIKFKQNR